MGATMETTQASHPAPPIARLPNAEPTTTIAPRVTNVRMTSETPKACMYVFVGGTTHPEWVSSARSATCTKKADTNWATAKTAARASSVAVVRLSRLTCLFSRHRRLNSRVGLAGAFERPAIDVGLADLEPHAQVQPVGRVAIGPRREVHRPCAQLGRAVERRLHEG